jgi:hypothetical protein
VPDANDMVGYDHPPEEIRLGCKKKEVEKVGMPASLIKACMMRIHSDQVT